MKKDEFITWAKSSGCRPNDRDEPTVMEAQARGVKSRYRLSALKVYNDIFKDGAWYMIGSAYFKALEPMKSLPSVLLGWTEDKGTPVDA